MISRDERMMFLQIAAEGVLLVIIISLMGWVLLTWPDPPPKTPQLILPESVRLHTGMNLREYTAALNAEMERRTRK